MSFLQAQQTVLEPLLQAARSDRLHGSYIFEGPQGVGKREAALYIARAAACESEDPMARPCGSCPTCHHMLRGSHPDLVVVGPDEGKKIRMIGVESIRDVIRQTRLHRYAARRRTFVLDPADILRDEAANALLKTLEEPPAGTGFILVTAKASTLLPTVLSRSQRVRFHLSSEDLLLQQLQAQGVEKAHQIARWADGRPGLAQALVEGEMEEILTCRQNLLELLAGSPSDLFSFTEGITKGNKKGRAGWEPVVERNLFVIEALLRDASLLRIGGTQLLNADIEPTVHAWSQALYPNGIHRINEALHQTRTRMALNVNARLLLEPLLAQLASELGRARSHP
ncbi:MAG: DNA polymerase III subunit delta' C-terminal domain-containing protein [Myxococcota bacterium]|nr:DNA polymerase III subunit delta' C-terminal domain-containing protein [Myxococcota bacterium]